MEEHRLFVEILSAFKDREIRLKILIEDYSENVDIHHSS